MTTTGEIWNRKLKIAGLGLVFLGLLSVGGGAIGAVAFQFIPDEECDLADQLKAEADRLSRDADAAHGTPNEQKLRQQALEKTRSAQAWAEGCSKRKSEMLGIGAIFGGIFGVLGLALTGVGLAVFFLTRRSG